MERLRDAAQDLAFLLRRGYPDQSALRFVGNHHQLPAIQRRILSGALSGFVTALHRRGRRIFLSGLSGRTLIVDGYNVSIAAESVLEGRLVVTGADGALRDAASLSRTAGPVRREAVEILVSLLVEARPQSVSWYFDAPVSGSGEVAAWVRSLPHPGIEFWMATAIPRVDETLGERAAADPSIVVASADVAILDRAGVWFDLPMELARRRKVRPIELVHLGEDTPDDAGQ